MDSDEKLSEREYPSDRESYLAITSQLHSQVRFDMSLSAYEAESPHIPCWPWGVRPWPPLPPPGAVHP